MTLRVRVRSLVRPAVLLRQCRPFSGDQPLPKPLGQQPSDPRPPWVFTTSRLLSLVVAPSIIFYAVFFADFGEREHVFMPIRRWATRQKAAFFTLSPSELGLLEANEARVKDARDRNTTEEST